jgi:pimeloyl-ACP methyl ester carboxylesterase
MPSASTTMTQPAASSPTLILIHGASGNGQMWTPVRRHLDPGRTALAPDLPGHATRRTETFTLAGAVATVVATAATVAPAKVVLVGDSLGGYTAMASASALPREQLAGLVLGGCTANMVGSAYRSLRIRQAVIGSMLAVIGPTRMAQMVGKALRKAGQTDEDVQAQLDAGFNHRVFPQAVAALHGVDFRAILAAIEVPVLIVNGSKDRIFVDQEDSFMAVARNATQHRFENCEHGVSIHRSAEFAALIDGMARRVAA